MRIAFVVQRYGIDVAGGSEALCRQVAERLGKIHKIDVLTTCAKDYITWKNEYSEGIELINSVLVRRFKVDKERDLKKFNAFTQMLFNGPHTEQDELQWIKDQGPFVPGILDFIRSHENDYDLFVFFTYRYYPSFFGLPLVSEKSILVPTAENEPTLNLNVNKAFFCLPKAVIYLTEEEKHIIIKRFKNQSTPNDVIGLGLTIPHDVDGDRFKTKYHLFCDFILYIGRIDGNKGCSHLFEYFIKYKKEKPSNLKLILIGKAEMEIPKNTDILHLGFLSDIDKFDGIKAAKILIMPSEFESYSIVVTEAWALGTPTLVNERCAVLKGHCLRSNGGLFYSDFNEFAICIDMLLSNNNLRERLGNQGRRYVRDNYNWDRVERKYLELFEIVRSGTQ
jgi:glycosyltransferase involved in cell wall biosynthesis